jgi:hypothetical protein
MQKEECCLPASWLHELAHAHSVNAQISEVRKFRFFRNLRNYIRLSRSDVAKERNYGRVGVGRQEGKCKEKEGKEGMKL